MDNIRDRIDQAHAQILSVKNKRSRRDLNLMIRNVEAAYTKLDIEKVQCRRLHRATPKYNELLKNCEELLNHLETHITFATLLG